MSNETDIKSYTKVTYNLSPQALEDLRQASKIHRTTQRKELMDALARNKRLADIEMLGLRLGIVDANEEVIGYVLFNGQVDIRLEDPEEFPPNVIPFHSTSG